MTSADEKQNNLLLHLVNDIFAMVVAYIDTTDVLRLVSTGNAIVRDKLKQPHVVNAISISALSKHTLPFDSVETWTRHFPHARHLRITGSVHSLSSLRIITSRLPLALETFSIPGAPSSIYKQFDLTTLPTSLQTLKLHGHCLPLVINFELLPVKELDVTIFPEISKLMNHLPPSVTKLTIRKSPGDSNASEVILSTNLPEALIDFQFPMCRFQPEWIQYLPSGLQRLSLEGWISSNKTDHFHQLPPNLLEFQAFVNSHQQEDTMIAHLPRSLTSLRLGGNFSLSDRGISKLPSRLTSLALFGNINGANPFKLLPRSLVDLYLNCNFGGYHHEIVSAEDILHLPPLLSSFCVYPNMVNIPDILSLLPASITKVNLGNARGASGDTFLDESFDFPQNFRILRISQLKWSNDMINFPSNLQTLILDVRTMVVDNNLLRALPRNLVVLNTSTTDKRSETELDFAHLPRTLTYLNIPLEHGLITESNTKHLPGLRDLIFNGDLFIADNLVKHLPRTLITLSLNSNNLLTNACIDDLPPNLTHLDLLSNTNLTTAIVTRLPYNGHYSPTINEARKKCLL
jgi:hypothetical protein